MAPTEQDIKKWGVVEDFLYSTVYNTHFSDCEKMHYDSFSAYSKGLDNRLIFLFYLLKNIHVNVWTFACADQLFYKLKNVKLQPFEACIISIVVPRVF